MEAALRERRNLLVPINNLPVDILLLIPTHLTSLSDRLRVTFVCRHWRTHFLQYPPLWSELCLVAGRDQHLVTTHLERVKGYPLDVTLDYCHQLRPDLTSLLPFAQQIKDLFADSTDWDDIEELSASISGLLPFLRTLAIEDVSLDNIPHPPPAPVPFFGGATNLKEFSLTVWDSPPLWSFNFPNLTTFNLRTWARSETYPVSCLLGFLEASPSLQQIDISVGSGTFWEDIPPDRVLVLPCVELFSLCATTGGFGCEILTHISCPAVKSAKFKRLGGTGDTIPEDIHPPSQPLSTLIRQYSSGTVEEVIIEPTMDEDLNINCSLGFRSPGGATLQLIYVQYPAGDPDNIGIILDKCFSQISGTMKNLPLTSSARNLCIRSGGFPINSLVLTTNNIGKLLGVMGPLEGLTLSGCNLRPYLGTFVDTPLLPDTVPAGPLPAIKELTIVNPARSFRNDERSAAGIVKLARLQSLRGIPFGRMIFHTEVPFHVVEELLLSVSEVERL